MIETPEIVDVPAQAAAVIRLTIPRDQIQVVMGPAIEEVLSVLGAQGITPAGPLVTHHFDITEATFDFEVGFPVAGSVVPSGRAYTTEVPAVHAARTIYHGGYEGLGEAWSEFDAWLQANGHQTAPGIREHYRVGPESGGDASQWRTELVHPLAS